MSLQVRLSDLITAVGADYKQLRTWIAGSQVADLTGLTTTAKTSLLAAINEINAKPAGADPWTYQAVTTAYTNSTITPSDVIAGFVAANSTRYMIEFRGSVSAAAATTGVQVALSGPTSGITRSAVKIVSASAATTDMITHTTINSFQVAAASLTTPTMLYLDAIVEAGAAVGTASNIRVRAQSEVAGSAITIYPGSFMRWRTF